MSERVIAAMERGAARSRASARVAHMGGLLGVMRAYEREAAEYDELAEQARQSAAARVARSAEWWDRVAAEFRRRHGGGSASGLTPEQCAQLVAIANEMRGEVEIGPNDCCRDQATCVECREAAKCGAEPTTPYGLKYSTGEGCSRVAGHEGSHCNPSGDTWPQIGPQEQADAMADHEDEFATDPAVKHAYARTSWGGTDTGHALCGAPTGPCTFDANAVTCLDCQAQDEPDAAPLDASDAEATTHDAAEEATTDEH